MTKPDVTAAIRAVEADVRAAQFGYEPDVAPIDTIAAALAEASAETLGHVTEALRLERRKRRPRRRRST